MARPDPTIIRCHTDAKWRTLDVIEAATLFVVTYRDKMINLRTGHALKNVGWKYGRTTFIRRHYAQSKADKLNALFRTNDFGVRDFS